MNLCVSTKAMFMPTQERDPHSELDIVLSRIFGNTESKKRHLRW
jgi:hypothetical protein